MYIYVLRHMIKGHISRSFHMKQSKQEYDVAGCLVFHGDEFLILRRHPNKAKPLTWDIPAGKIEPSEDREVGMVRELFEETGIRVSTDELVYLGMDRIEEPTYILHFHVFRYDVQTKPEITVSPSEHTESTWITVKRFAQEISQNNIIHVLLERSVPRETI